MTPGAFVPARDNRFYLLARHRQPLPANVARVYIEEFTAPGDLVVDPFAASPTVARIAYESGRRSLAVDSNPLVAFAARVQATLSEPRAIANALARWGEVPKENELLRDHISQLYASVCADCGRQVTVDYFLWARDPGTPIEKLYTCPTCGSRRDPTVDSDRSRAAEIRPRGFHYHLLLERIGALESQHYNLLRELLALYTPRNLYALATLSLKLDAEFQDDDAREILMGCLIHALDVGTTLYPALGAWPERQTPEVFLEVNIWRALEEAAAGLAMMAPGLQQAESADEAMSANAPALWVGPGSAHALAEKISGDAALVLSSPARLDPRFFELSYLWTRWTLGKAASRSLEPFLDAERQRWGWYGSALASSLRDAARLLRKDGRVVACFPAGSHAMIEALCIAAAPDFRIESFAFRPEPGARASSEFGATRGDYRVVWNRRGNPKSENSQVKVPETGGLKPSEDNDKALLREVAVDIRRGALIGALEILASRGEALAYSWIHHRALLQLERQGTFEGLLGLKFPARDNAFQFFRRELEAGLKEGYARDLDHWKEAGSVLWLRRQGVRDRSPLTDRVEEAVREILESANRISTDELEDLMLARFPELLTPEAELIQLCANAYAEVREGEWHRRELDVKAELARAQELVARLGHALNYQVHAGEAPFDQVWEDEKVVPASSGGAVEETRVREGSHVIVFRARPDWKELLESPAAPRRGLIVIPESQVRLTGEKLRRLPTLVKPLKEAGWEFLRIPFVEVLLRSQLVERAEFQLALGLEPALAKDKEQLELF